MKLHLTTLSLFVCSLTIAMEKPTDPLALIVSNAGYREIPDRPKNPSAAAQKTVTLNTTSATHTSFIDRQKTKLYDLINPDKDKLILVVKDPINNDSHLSHDQKKIVNYSGNKKISIPSEIIVHAALERASCGHMAAQTKLPYILADKELDAEIIVDNIKTALREYNNLLSPEALEYHAHRLANLIIAISLSLEIASSKL
jgi:hypothetical protein